jgi:DNA-directed RNA polymerase subunit omega
MERIPERIDSTFRYVLIAARRAEQLLQGARPRVEPGLAKPTRVAMREVTENLVDWDYGPPPMPEPEPQAEDGVEEPAVP